ncbi:hypothetical protein PM082_022363 [Marasmius tenuissimus]|nr:hypothetical protein PM082_022363 [Marasmius tenuissimus]
MATRSSSSSSPIHALSAELLREIFLICHEDFPILVIQIGNLDKRIGPYGSPVLALSAVSSQWRELALSFGNLWSHIRYIIGQPSGVEKDDEADSQMCYQATKHYLDRAGTSPLTLSFHDDTGLTDTKRGADFGLALDTLCRHAPRWAAVEFQVEKIFFEQNALTLQLLRGNLHNLHTFIVREIYDNTITDDTLSGVADILGPYPSLRQVTLEGLHELPPHDLLSRILPWKQLDGLTLTNCSAGDPDVVFGIVSLCSNLRDLTFSVDEDDPRPLATHTHAISWSNVQTLTITGSGYESPIFQDFLQRVTLPVLISLEFRFSGLMYRRGVRPKSLFSGEQEARLHNFILHSGASITSLTVHELHITNEQIVDLLQLLPNVTDLFIADELTLGFTWYESDSSNRMDTVSPSHLFDRLQTVDLSDNHEGTHPRSGSFLPRLRDLTIGARGMALAHDALAKAVRSRWIPDPETSARLGVDSLRSVEVFFIGTEPTVPIPESLLSLQDLRCAGLRVVLPDFVSRYRRGVLYR